MKNILTALLSLTALVASPLFAAENIPGQWSGSVKSGDGSQESNMMLKINDSNGRLTGVYCFVTQGGNRIDCPDDNTENLHGTLTANKAEVVFDSTFGGKNGKAELAFSHGQLTWTLISAPKGGEYYAPESYVLRKKDTSAIAIKKRKTFATDSFMVTIVNGCGDFNALCSDVTYYGMRKKDNSQITLQGRTISDSGTNVANAAVFKTGNVEYIVSFEPVSLKVIQGDKVLVNQKGEWK